MEKTIGLLLNETVFYTFELSKLVTEKELYILYKQVFVDLDNMLLLNDNNDFDLLTELQNVFLSYIEALYQFPKAPIQTIIFQSKRLRDNYTFRLHD